MITKQKIKQLIVWFSVMLVLTSLCLFYPFWNKPIINLLCNRFNIVSSKNNLMVHFISVGNGDAIAVNLPDGKILLIDAGLQETNISYTNYLQHNVLNNTLNDKIDYLIITHADIDHSGGAMKVLKNFDVEKVFLPKHEGKEYYTELKEFVNENNKLNYISSKIDISAKDYKIEIFEPIETDKTNDNCPLIKIEYKQKSFLFTGDISSSIEKKMIDNYGYKLDCDVLKIAHHGSNTSTCQEFLDITTPDYAVISVGNNSHGHPTSSVLNRIENANAKCLRTDVNGNVLFVVGDNYNLKNINDKYWITSFSLDYRNVILVVNGLIIIKVVCVVVKKEGKKNRRSLHKKSKNT